MMTGPLLRSWLLLIQLMALEPTVLTAFPSFPSCLGSLLHPSQVLQKRKRRNTHNILLNFAASKPDENSASADKEENLFVALEEFTKEQVQLTTTCSSTSVDDDTTRSIDCEKGTTDLSPYFLPDPNDNQATSFCHSLTSSQRQRIQEFLSEIYLNRKRRAYAKSDALTIQLKRQFGIRLYHGNPSYWTTQKGAAPTFYIRAKLEQEQQDRVLGDGGHPYSPHDNNPGDGESSSISPLTNAQINNLLVQKTQAKNQGAYERAKAIQFELRINGVEVNEQTRQWRRTTRATIIEGNESSWNAEKSSTTTAAVTMPNKNTDIPVFRQRLTSQPSSPQIVTRVQQLVADRARAMVQQQTELADFLALELRRTYGVMMDDDEQEWFIVDSDDDDDESTAIKLPKSSSSPQVVQQRSTTPSILKDPQQPDNDETWNNHDMVPPLLFIGDQEDLLSAPDPDDDGCPYRQSTHSQTPTNDAWIMTRIPQLVQQRCRKREQGKFREADAIRTELWETYHVGINDRLQQWSVGGVFD
ncbi:expressed unknown protein [Seminavis robusta]|uniref:Uncharacterized protein n=1 Tax=Seminavis robusta TaxID=568900 RepID=A0A9N8DMZ8_9STRA|nr:expressed unknown protein [Seminavis robusta]|eukprot:Sro145_g067170.1 n/a (528) ;mRNA; r:5513-7096